MVQLWCVIVGYGTVIMVIVGYGTVVVCDSRLGCSYYGDSRLWYSYYSDSRLACSYYGDSKTKFIRNLFCVDGSKKCCILIRGGFSTGDRFEFGSVDQQVRNRGINPG